MTRLTPIATLTATALSLSLPQFAAAQTADPAGGACEKGYSATDVNGDGYVSTIEMNAYVEKDAADMDADKSGTVSRDEYVNCSLAGQTAAASNRTEDDMAALDTDGDGTISQSEFMNAGAGSHAAAQGGDTAAADRASRMIYQGEGAAASDMTQMSLDDFAARSALLFMTLDRNGNAGLTKEEFMQDAVTTNMSDIRNADFDQADSDKSGDLTTTELIEYNTKRADDAMKRATEETGEAQDVERGVPVLYFRFTSRS